jgi:hypothetical protein
MPKRRVHDYRSMSEAQLRALAREARAQERAARYAKGRRSWKAAAEQAEDELRRRGIEV